jgi:NAD(P)-dependent dehydrogenase (short-subunit alcohol dehydrogenase family)
MGQVEGKVAIVTGGASGIGAACAATLAREGAKVVVTDLDDIGGQAVVDKIGSAGGEAICLHQDVSIEESWPGVIEATERRFGRLDAECPVIRKSESGRAFSITRPSCGKRLA